MVVCKVLIIRLYPYVENICRFGICSFAITPINWNEKIDVFCTEATRGLCTTTITNRNTGLRSKGYPTWNPLVV